MLIQMIMIINKFYYLNPSQRLKLDSMSFFKGFKGITTQDSSFSEALYRQWRNRLL